MPNVSLYFVDARGTMREFHEGQTPPPPAAISELGWRQATEAEVGNYVAGWPITSTERVHSLSARPPGGSF